MKWRSIFTLLIIVLLVISLVRIREARPVFTEQQLVHTNDRDPNDYYWSTLQIESERNTVVVFAAAFGITALWIQQAARYITPEAHV